jgi:hypothetical protein
MGLMLAGDANDDDQVNTSDFVILKATFGKGCGDRADFIGNCVVDLIDFGLLKVNFGRGGAPLVGPR